MIAFSPDGTFLATGGGCLDGYVKLWRSSDGALIRSFEACTNGVTALVFSPDMSRLAVAGDRDEQVIKFWTLDGIQYRTLPGHPGGTGAIVFSPDGALLASCGPLSDNIVIRNLTNVLSTTFFAHTGGLRDIAFSSSGALLASVGRRDGRVKVFASADWSLVVSKILDGGQFVAFSQDETVLEAGGIDRIQFWRTSNWQISYSDMKETYRVSSFGFSPSGACFVFGREDGTTGRFWNPQASPVIVTLALKKADSDGTRRLFVQNTSRLTTITSFCKYFSKYKHFYFLTQPI